MPAADPNSEDYLLRRRYVHTLIPYFEHTDNRFREYLYTILRANDFGIGGIDPLDEIKKINADLEILRLNFPNELVPEPDNTRCRLAMLSYALLIELDAPYNLIANLLRLRIGYPYSAYPFVDIEEKKKILIKLQALNEQFLETDSLNRGQIQQDIEKKERQLKTLFFSSTRQKIATIKELENKLDFETLNLSPEVTTFRISEIFAEYYYPEIRNAIFHSDFNIVDNQFILGRDTIEINGRPNSIIPFQFLGSIQKKAVAFYDAFRHLDYQTRLNLASLPNTLVNDREDKSIIELVPINNLLSGFVIHWPNGKEAKFIREEANCSLSGINFDLDGSLVFERGEIYESHHPFSPLLPPDQEPVYTPLQSGQPLHWTFDL